jgi:hypothetical protein
MLIITSKKCPKWLVPIDVTFHQDDHLKQAIYFARAKMVGLLSFEWNGQVFMTQDFKMIKYHILRDSL